MSKDPSLGVGAVIVDHRKRMVSSGFNGLPSGIDFDSVITTDRETKLMCTIHAEENAMAFAWQDIAGYYLFSTRHPCARCAAMIVQRGLHRVYYLSDPSDTVNARWRREHEMARYLLDHAGIVMFEWELERTTGDVTYLPRGRT
jgi:dCMP deaminase